MVVELNLLHHQINQVNNNNNHHNNSKIALKALEIGEVNGVAGIIIQTNKCLNNNHNNQIILEIFLILIILETFKVLEITIRIKIGNNNLLNNSSKAINFNKMYGLNNKILNNKINFKNNKIQI